MSNDSGNTGDESGEQGRDDGRENPFKGTPFEQLFSAFGGGAGFGAGAGMPDFGGLDLSGLMGQMQAMMQPYDGPVNWNLATDIARRTVAQESDPTPSMVDRQRVADAIRLADHWLDEATSLPSGVSTAEAWSRADWIQQTTDTWRVLVEPVAQNVVSAMGNAMPEEARAMAGPLLGMIGKAGGAMFGTQVGQALGGLAGEVLGTSDIGLPVGPKGKAALVLENVREFAADLDVSQDDVVLYLALHEAAHQRLFAHVPWLRQHLISSIEDFGRGVQIDVSGIEQQLRGLDPMNPQAMAEAMEGGLFEPQQSAAQKAALLRLETTLALVSGWVDEVVGQATAERMPAAVKLHELLRRRRAAGGPAEQTFGALVGLELRPRRLRDASTLWGSLRSRQGADGRDAVWAHPDLLPTDADLDDPLGFREDLSAPAEISDEDFDAALAQLLDTEQDSSGEGPADDPADDDE
jgi:putative hydrolase